MNDHENLGVLFRNAAAFGLDAVVLDQESADPLYRRCVRVSIGHVCTVPWSRYAHLAELRAAGFTLLALTPAPDATPLLKWCGPHAPRSCSAPKGRACRRPRSRPRTGVCASRCDPMSIR